MRPLRSLAGLIAGAALVASACDDPTAFDATIPVFTDTLSVFAMSGTPPSYPSALNLFNITTTRLESGAAFEIAFDIDETGTAVIYPASLVTASLTRVGIRDTAATFEQVMAAPRGEYPFDEAVVLTGGRTAIIEAQSGLCQFSFSPFFYSKLTVDSVNLANRQLFLRVTVDPNCGFRSFGEGIPRN